MSPHADDPRAVVELVGLRKAYPGVVANDDVNLVLRQGEVHAVVGENGAGKSTMLRLLYGEIVPDGGEIRINGEPVRLRGPADAIARGIGMVHQHFMLADNLSVLENVVLGHEPTRAMGWLDRRAARARLKEVIERFGMEVDVDARTGDLGVGQRQRVEILKALYREATILVLDEPTAVLVPHEVEGLFHSLADMQEEGLSILFISHKLDEVLQVADRVTVLRGGVTRGTHVAADIDAARLAREMVDVDAGVAAATVTDVPSGEVALNVEGLSVWNDGRPAVDRADLTVRCGEIRAIAGVEGNGQRELIEAIAGLLSVSAGTVTLHGLDITHLSAQNRRRWGLAYVPEDRHREGLLLDGEIWENMLPGNTGLREQRRMFVDRRGARRLATEAIRQFDVRTRGVRQQMSGLSGGNQQKILVGRELATRPRVLLAAQPTRGVDFASQHLIWARIRDACEAGLAVLLVTADLTELFSRAHTVQVMTGGALSEPLDVGTLTPYDLGRMMTTRSTAPVQERDGATEGAA